MVFGQIFYDFVKFIREIFECYRAHGSILVPKYNLVERFTNLNVRQTCKYLQVPYFCSPLIEKTMKKGIHPEYNEVIFWDTSSDVKFLTRSTLKSKEMAKWTDGKEYPVVKVEVSSASHPFFTGKKMFVDTAGRVEKFQKKYQKKA